MQGNGAVEGALGNTLGWEEEFPPQQSGVTEQSLEAHPVSQDSLLPLLPSQGTPSPQNRTERSPCPTKCTQCPLGGISTALPCPVVAGALRSCTHLWSRSPEIQDLSG